MKLLRSVAASALMLPCVALAQIAILQIHVVEGEGVVHQPGTRSARALVVEVTDETGRAVERAAVSFHLPDDGAGGTFLSGLRTEVAMTDSGGRAAIHGLQWNGQPGQFQIRIVASREQARAGIVSFQYIADSAGKTHPAATATKSKSKWLVIATLVVAGAAAGVVNGSRSKSATATPAAATPAPATTLTIGTPTLTVGKP